MNETDNIQYAPIRNHNYEDFFRKFQYNGGDLSDSVRKELIKAFDDAIAEYSEGIPMLKVMLDIFEDIEDDYIKAYRTALSADLVAMMIFADCLVICKYFLLADKDYEKRFMRGRMKIILNEGFKRLYGFDAKTKKESVWRRLIKAVELCSDEVKCQYKELSERLEKHSKSSSWWKDERDLETHIDTEKLYESRYEDIVEGEVMADAMTLLYTLFAIDSFTSEVYDYFKNIYHEKYRNQEMKNGGHNL